mgnify:CR=1 FL=1
MATTSTTTGINVSGIPKINSALESYKAKVKKQADSIGAKTAIIKQAIQGDKTLANLQTGLTSINNQIQELLKSLNVYSDYLNSQLKSTYQKHDASNESFYSKPNTQS